MHKGDLLAKVNDKPLQAQLKKLEAQYKLAQDRVYRQNALLEKDAVSKEAYQQATTDFATLKADIELIKANIAQTELRAPFDGIIGLRQVSEGAYAATQYSHCIIDKNISVKNRLRRSRTLCFTDKKRNQAHIYYRWAFTGICSNSIRNGIAS